jgi:hypothetical protein
MMLSKVTSVKKCEIGEAEEHNFSAAEVVEEVYDDSVTGNPIHLQQEDKNGDGGEARGSAAACDRRKTAISLFLGGPEEPSKLTPEGDSLPHGSKGLLGSDEVPNELKKQSSSRHDKRKAMYNTNDLLGSVPGNPLGRRVLT